MMSGADFLSSIRSFSKTGLKQVSTRTTMPTGVQVVSSSQDPIGKVVTGSPSAGFVVDDKPDKRIGIVMHHLIVGSMDVAEDEELLDSLSVTHVLNACSFFREGNPFPGRFSYLNLQMLDTPEYDMRQDLKQAIDFIDSSARDSGRCLVHCNAGVSRSTSLVIGYLICRHGMSFDAAFEFVKKVYPKARPNEGFVRQLKQLTPGSMP